MPIGLAEACRLVRLLLSVSITIVLNIFPYFVKVASAVTPIPAPPPVLQLGGTGPGYFGDVNGVALDSNGNIYVTDRQNRRVQKFDSQGNYLGQFPVAIEAIAITIANGIVYVVGQQGGSDNNLLVEYDESGNFIKGIGGAGVTGSAFLSVAVDPSGNVYVVEGSHGNIFKFAPDGTLLDGAFGGLPGHEAVATDGSFIYATSALPGGGQTTFPIQKYSFSGRPPLAQWGTASQFSVAVGLAIDSNGNFHVSNYPTHQVITFQVSGPTTLTLINQIGSLGQGNGQFYYPVGVATDAAGNTYVADSGNSRVQIFDKNLNFVNAFGKSSLSGIYNNAGITSTADGHIYVVDTLPPYGQETRFSAFDSLGNLTFRRYFFDVLPSRYSTLDYPTSVATAADGSIYVYFGGPTCTYGYGSPIFKFDSRLNFVTAANSPGCPGGLTIDPLGLIYAAAGSTVNIYDGNLNRTGTFQIIGTYGHGVTTTGSIAVDSQGAIYVTTGSNLGIYNALGNLLGFFPLPGSILAAAPDRSLFVGDASSDTLSVFPAESTNAQVVWNLPYFPDNLHVDQSRVYVVGGGCGALVCAVEVFVYSPPMFVSAVTPPIGGDTGGVTITITGADSNRGLP